MQYTVTHTCGHTITHQIYNGSAYGRKRSAWLATQPCLTCKREADNAAAAEVNAAAGLPTLTGSAKQVAWAETIRAKGLASFDEYRAEIMRRAKGTEAQVAEANRQWDAVRAWIAGQADAGWWIDRRGNLGYELFREAVPAVFPKAS